MTFWRVFFLSVIAILFGPPAALAEAEGEFDGYCTMGLAEGKEIKTDCSINAVIDGRTYCFGNETAKIVFLKKPEEFLDKAAVFYMSKTQPQ